MPTENAQKPASEPASPAAAIPPALIPASLSSLRTKPGRLRRIARIWGLITLLSAAALLFPFVFEDILPIEDGGGALMVFGFLGTITGIITALVYARMARAESRILSDPSLVVARWDMDRAEWTGMVESIAKARKAETSGTFRLLLAGCAVAAIPSFLLTSVGFTLIFIPSLLAAMFLLSQAVPRIQRSRLLRSGGRVVIAKDAVLRGSEFHSFSVAGNRFEDLSWDGSRLRFVYSSASNPGRQEHELIIEVPELERNHVPAILAAYGGRWCALVPIPRIDSERDGI